MPRGDGRAGARPRHPGAVVAALIWPRYRSSLSPDFGVRLTLRWREPDSNHRSRRERDGPAADHRRLARRPVLNDPIQLIDPASLVGNSERLFTRAGPMVRIRFPPAESLQTFGSRSRRPADYRTRHAGYGVKASLPSACCGRGWPTSGSDGCRATLSSSGTVSAMPDDHHPMMPRRNPELDETLPHRRRAEVLLMVATSAVRR